MLGAVTAGILALVLHAFFFPAPPSVMPLM